MTDPQPTKARVKEFWESAPLFEGESHAQIGTREYFLEHEAVYLSDVFPEGRIGDHYFPFPAGGSILDVGCGPGFWTRQLARRGYRTTAVDLTQNAVLLTQKSLDIFALKAEVRTGDAEALPFDDESFDGLISHGVIHHTPNTERCVAEMARVIKPTGEVVVSVYFKNRVLRSQMMSRLAGLALSKAVTLPGRGREKLLSSGDPGEIVRLYDGASNPLGKSYTCLEFTTMFENAGFEILRTWRYYVPLRSLGRAGRLVKPLHASLDRRLGLMIAVHARKVQQ